MMAVVDGRLRLPRGMVVRERPPRPCAHALLQQAGEMPSVVCVVGGRAMWVYRHRIPLAGFEEGGLVQVSQCDGPATRTSVKSGDGA